MHVCVCVLCLIARIRLSCAVLIDARGQQQVMAGIQRVTDREGRLSGAI